MFLVNLCTINLKLICAIFLPQLKGHFYACVWTTIVFLHIALIVFLNRNILFNALNNTLNSALNNVFVVFYVFVWLCSCWFWVKWSTLNDLMKGKHTNWVTGMFLYMNKHLEMSKHNTIGKTYLYYHASSFYIVLYLE